MDRDAYRQQSLETWALMAPGWEDRREWLMETTGRVNEWLLDAADPGAGERVLEVAAGTGDLGFRAADRVGPDGTVISSDFSPEMIEVARRNPMAEQRSNVELRVLDAENMELDDDSVDAVLCRWGYMLMADPGAALGETRRVLRDGGRLAFAVWANPEDNPWAALPAMTLIQRGHLPPPEPGMPGIFAMADRDRIRELMSGAGFDSPRIEEIPLQFEYADFDDLWDSVVRLAGPLAAAIAALDESEGEATREATRSGAAALQNDDGTYSAPGLAIGVAAA